MTALPALQQFRTEFTADRILHLVFDAPGRSMKVFASRHATATPGLESADLWFEHPSEAEQKAGARLLVAAAAAAARHASTTSETDQRVIDYALVTDPGFPGYLGGPSALLRYLGSERIERLLGTSCPAPP